MKETFNYPNGGFEFTVVHKEDIIETINANIKDKEVILEIIKNLEVDATSFINQGRWTGIPYLGSIKFKKGKLMNRQKEQAELIDEAFNTLNKKEYYLFRTKLAQENDKVIRNNRLYAWMTSLAAHRNIKLYKSLVKNYGDNIAKVMICSLFKVTEAPHLEEYDN